LRDGRPLLAKQRIYPHAYSLNTFNSTQTFAHHNTIMGDNKKLSALVLIADGSEEMETVTPLE
jgi:hypothetical protein